MTTQTDLEGRPVNVLVVEDDYFLAKEVATGLMEHGITVVGPVSNVDDAIELIDATNELGAALLDVNLGSELVFPVADALMAHRIPFIFTTGYDMSAIPEQYAFARKMEKPVDIGAAVRLIRSELLH